ncbi:MAG: hypothetical protein PHV66_08660, partial [Bacteroidales bacterium]|nr:hypothetical protein [Bacteroidales bacterium]
IDSSFISIFPRYRELCSLHSVTWEIASGWELRFTFVKRSTDPYASTLSYGRKEKNVCMKFPLHLSVFPISSGRF